jgi:hypothetical protein
MGWDCRRSSLLCLLHEGALLCGIHDGIIIWYKPAIGQVDAACMERGRQEENCYYLNYPEVVHNRFNYSHAVDDHNAKRLSPISLEVTWATKWWRHRAFSLRKGGG